MKAALFALLAALVLAIVFVAVDNRVESSPAWEMVVDSVVPSTAQWVEACFDYADRVHEEIGGEATYNFCSANEAAYESWKQTQ